MDDLLAELLWNNCEISHRAVMIRRSLPGFADAKRGYDAASARLRAAAGYELFDQFVCQLGRYMEYETLSYYALGLGLREAFVRELCV